LFAQESVCEALMLCFFARSHALTATEEHVLGILCQGFSAPQIAAQMKVAVSTIRSHMRSFCTKTHSSGVRQLVNRVAVLPRLPRRSGSNRCSEPRHDCDPPVPRAHARVRMDWGGRKS
jgi:DNA-binding CsgD family transcriptional regulator